MKGGKRGRGRGAEDLPSEPVQKHTRRRGGPEPKRQSSETIDPSKKNYPTKKNGNFGNMAATLVEHFTAHIYISSIILVQIKKSIILWNQNLKPLKFL